MFTRALCLALFFHATISPCLAAHAPRRVFLLDGLNPNQVAATETQQAFKQRLKEKSPQPIEVFSDFLDLGRFPGEQADKRLVQMLRAKFGRTNPDLIVATTRNALIFLARHRDEVAPGVPVTYCCTPTTALAALHLPPDLPGVAITYDWKGTFDLARRLQPAAKTLAIVSGASGYGLAWQKEVIEQLHADLKHYDVRYIASADEGDRLQEVSRLPRNSIVILMPIFGEELSGYSPGELATNLARASSSPAYSPIPTLMGRGIVGGYLDTYRAQGTKAADLALEILSGKAPSALPHQTTLPVLARVDARQLERWNLSEDALPPGASVEFRQPTLWERYGIAIAVVLLALALEAGIIALLLFQRRKRRIAEAQLKESEERHEAIADAQRKEIGHLMRVAILGELSGSIAHELGQPLSAIMINAQAGQKLLAGRHYDMAALAEILEEIVQDNIRASDVIGGLRRLLKKGEHKVGLIRLNDLITSTLGLLHSELVNKRIKVEAALARNLPLVWGDPIQLQQVLLNLIMNGMEAMAAISAAQRVLVISTLRDGGDVMVTVTNQGPSLSADELKQIFQPYFTTKERGLGLGLSICSRILSSHGGTLTLSNASGGGVTAVVSMPMAVPTPVQVAS